MVSILKYFSPVIRAHTATMNVTIKSKFCNVDVHNEVHKKKANLNTGQQGPEQTHDPQTN